MVSWRWRMLNSARNELTKSESAFVRDAFRQRGVCIFFYIVGVLSIIFGGYLFIFQHRVLFHVDRLLAEGKIYVTLGIVQNMEPKTNMEHLQRALIQEAFDGYLPPLFAALGSLALGFGALLLVYIRTQTHWLRIMAKLPIEKMESGV